MMPFEWVVGDSSKDHTVTAPTSKTRPATAGYTTLWGTTAPRWERCPRCPEDGAADCKSPGHRQGGFSGHVLSMSRRRTKRVEVAPGVVETVVLRPGWSFANLTRRRLREERRAWMDANLPADVGGGLDTSQVKLMEWLNERRAARWAERTSGDFARAP